MAADQDGGFEQYRRATKRDVFLATLNDIVPWQALCEVIAPHYPKAGNGRPPLGLERMLRMHFVQHWFNLPDEACEEALFDSTAMRRFVGIDRGRERVPDGTTLLIFRRLLEKHPLPDLLHGNERRVNAGSAYARQKELIAKKAPLALDFINQRTRHNCQIDEVERAKNRTKSRVRARVECVFAVVKRLWGFTKVRYRGLVNLDLGRGRFLEQVRP